MAGTPFGRYLLLEELSEGGMARVYRALLRDSQASGFEKQVALKRVLKELGELPEFVARFTDEARIVSNLNHSNIAQVFDFGQVEGEYYLAMELIDGPDLGTLLEVCRGQGQPVPIPTALFISAEMARGLGAAHNREEGAVVHRDMSPQNLLLSRNGEVKVVDFGIAKTADKAIRTRTGMIMGKLQYMSPEQAKGENRKVDARSDIFSAGCVLFEILTDGQLFRGTTPEEVLQQVIDAPIPPPSGQNPEVPPELDEIVLCCLDRDRERRYPDGWALARELEALLHRINPDYSSDDLARFVRTIVPASSSAPAVSQTAITITDDPGDLARSGETLTPSQKRGRIRLLPLMLLVGLAIAGAAGGFLIARLAGPPRGEDQTSTVTRALERGKVIQHHGWSLTLKEAHRYAGSGGKTTLQLILTLHHPKGLPDGVGRYFTVHGVRPALWSTKVNDNVAPPGRLTLAFTLKSKEAPALGRLLFAPPEVPPLRLELGTGGHR